MRFLVALLAVLCVSACGTAPTNSEQGFVDQAGWERHQQVQLDVNAILQGMSQARAQNEWFAKRAQ